MSFPARSLERKSRRKMPRNPRTRQNKRAYLFESLEERLNLSLMFMEVDTAPNFNHATPTPATFADDLLEAQEVTSPGLTTGVVDMATSASLVDLTDDIDLDYYTFTALVDGDVHVAVTNTGGDPGGDGDFPDRLDVRVYAASPANENDYLDVQQMLMLNERYVGTFPAFANGQFFVRVAGDPSDHDANYDLRIWTSEQSDSAGANNNTFNNATPLGTVGATPLTTSGTITQPDRDFYAFDAAAGEEVSVRITMPEGTGYPFGPGGSETTNLGVRVWSSTGQIVATSNGTAGNVDIASFVASVDGAYRAEVYSGSFGQVNFYDLDISAADKPEGRVTGYVFSDNNQNTFRDPSEPALENVTVQIQIQGVGTETVDTDENGFYAFENLPFGQHFISLVPQPGVHVVYPDTTSSSAYTIAINENNLNADHLDFGTLEADFGDAPNSYVTELASDGARHVARGPLLGMFRDADSDARTPLDGTGDDDTGIPDDEDGVMFPNLLLAGTTVDLPVKSSPGGGELDVFFDWDRSLAFDAGEKLSFTLTGGMETIAIPVPAGAPDGSSYARFRISTAGGLGPAGFAADGEVEDYVFTVARAGFTVQQTGTSTEVTEPNTADTFTVVLDVQPTSDVVIDVSSGDLTEGFVAPAQLTFTPTNWNQPQSVFLTAADDALLDGDQFYDITLSINDAASDDNFDGLADQTVAAVTHDDDSAGLVVVETGGSTEVTEPNTTDTFSVALNVQPAGVVVIDVVSGDLTEGTVSPFALTFTPANWNVPQNVTLTAVADGIIDGSQNYNINLSVDTPSGDPAFDSITRAVAATTHDRPNFLITGSVDVDESGTTDTFSVVLNTPPTTDVVIDVTSGDTTEGTVSPATLTFTPADWNVAQIVTVTGVDDILADGDVNYSITLSVNDALSNNLFDDAPDQTVAAVTRDDEVAGFSVALSGLTTEVTEPATTDDFTVVLDAQPLTDVVILVTSNDSTEGSVSPTALTFTNLNWNTPQVVTLTAVDDAVIDGDVNYTITLSIDAPSSDDAFDAVGDATVDAVTHDDDVPGITVTLTDGSNEVTEPDSTDTFSVVLTTQPATDVVIDVSSSDTGEGTVAPATLTFNNANWNAPQVVTITAADDNLLDGDQLYNITLTVNDALSDDDYDGLVVVRSATTHDNESASFTVTESLGDTTVSESGTTDTFTVVLNAAPLSDVVILVSSGDTGEATVDVASLTFTPADWSVAQTVTVTGVDDALVDGDQTTTITLSVDDANSDDEYDPLPDQTVSVTTTDNDVAGFTVAESGGSTVVSETGTTDTFTVVLDQPPTTDVVLLISSGDTGEATVAPASLTFTSTNWNVPQTVTVTGVDDLIVDGPQITPVTISVDDANSDDAFDAVPDGTVSVTTLDDDVTALIIVESGGNTSVSEPSSTDTFTVALNVQPASNVVVNVTSGDPTEGTVAPTPLTFTTADWSTPQTVTLTAVDDPFNDGDINYNITVAVDNPLSDDTFDNLSVLVAAVTRDDDTPGFRGRKFHDFNGNGNDDSGADPGLQDWTIEIYQNNGSPSFNPGSPFAAPYGQTGEDILVGTAVTDSNGSYSFSPANVTGGLVNGQSYIIRELQQQGWQQTAPTAPGHYTLTYTAGTFVTNLDFGNSNAQCGVQPASTAGPFTVTANNDGLLSIQLTGAGTFTVYDATNTSVVPVYAFEQGTNIFKQFADGMSRASGIPSEAGIQRADIVTTANTVFTIRVTGTTASSLLRHTNAVHVDTARNLTILGSDCGATIIVKDDPAAGGSTSDAKSIFVGSYAGSLASFDNGTNLSSQFSGVKYNAAIINASYNSPIIAGIRIFGGAGDDIIRVGAEITQDSSLDGGSGDDVIRGGGGRATIHGRAGSDFIVGGPENDVLYGDDGDDYIHGGAGGDRIFGGNGNDVISGGAGDDPIIRGQNGDDRLSGGIGRDRLIGDLGSDTAYHEKLSLPMGPSVDVFVIAETSIEVLTAATGPLPGDTVEMELLALIDRFWADNNLDGPDTLDEIIGQLLP